MTIVKTIEVTTPYRTVTLPRVTHSVIGGFNYYTSHVYNTMGQPLSGGFQFPAWSEKSCQHWGVPVMRKEATMKFTPAQLKIVNMITDNQYTAIILPYRQFPVAVRAIRKMRANGATIAAEYSGGTLTVIRGKETRLQELARSFLRTHRAKAHITWDPRPQERVDWILKKFPELRPLLDAVR